MRDLLDTSARSCARAATWLVMIVHRRHPLTHPVSGAAGECARDLLDMYARLLRTGGRLGSPESPEHP